MSQAVSYPQKEEATCLDVSWRLTPLAKSLIWISGFMGVCVIAFQGLTPTPLTLGVTSLFLLLFLSSWFLGRSTLLAIQPTGVEPAIGFAWEKLTIRFGLHHVGGSFTARDILLYHGSEFERRGLFAYRASMAPGTSQWVEGDLRLAKRGRFRTHGLRIASTFPFGLIRWTSSWELPADLLALPRLGALRDPLSLIPPERETLIAHAGRYQDAEEFHALKRWRPGLSQRNVHWKSSARRNQLMLKELHGVRKPSIRLELFPPVVESTRHRSDKFLFERSICLTASLADFFLRRNYRVEVVCSGTKNAFFLEEQSGRSGLFGALTKLAELDLFERESVEATASPSPSMGRRSQRAFRIQICAGGGNLRDAGRQRLDILDPATKRWFQSDRRFSRVGFLQRRPA
ncbi:MAG: DUF58 domain-containing protein [Planctomycetota bacterium]|nr:DUF58 domain-containing protein [Planctomycetota bacterium]MDA1114092.1 DUF58 domain-containing protein [Planctomycetota bacterium]